MHIIPFKLQWSMVYSHVPHTRLYSGTFVLVSWYYCTFNLLKFEIPELFSHMLHRLAVMWLVSIIAS